MTTTECRGIGRLKSNLSASLFHPNSLNRSAPKDFYALGVGHTVLKSSRAGEQTRLFRTRSCAAERG